MGKKTADVPATPTDAPEEVTPDTVATEFTPEPVAEPVEPAATEEDSAPSATEPRLRYNGQIVVSDEMRTVGEQTFHHISIGDGSHYDLTEQEYEEKVYIAYPPQN